MSGQFSINICVGLFDINGFYKVSHSIKLRESFDLHLKVILGKFVHLVEHPFAYKVSLQSMHAERLGLTNGETFIS